MLPHQMERLRPQQGESGHTADSRHQVAHSTRSAPEGSLLNRLEVLEEAMDVLLAAQQVRYAGWRTCCMPLLIQHII
jgi:hypothetical protein